jgi:hypothetical protein
MTIKKLEIELNNGSLSLHLVNDKFTIIFTSKEKSLKLFRVKESHIFNMYNLLNNIKNDWYIKDYTFSDNLTCNDRVRLRYIRDKYGVNFDKKAIENKIANRVLAKRGTGKAEFVYH